MSSFVHLHTHSHYSLLSALPKIPELVAKAKALRMDTLALTDNGNLYGAIEFYKECRKESVKPIIGVDAYLAARSRRDKQAGIDNRRHRLLLLAENETGYKNLLKLVTASFLDGFYYKPRLDRELLERHGAGLIAVIPSWSGDAAAAIRAGEFGRATEIIGWYQEVFGSNRFFMEITRHPEIEGYENAMKTLAVFCRQNHIPLLAAHDVFYLEPADRKARETLLSVQTNQTDERRDFGGEEDFSFISAERAEELFRETPDALKNTREVAERCNLELTLGKWVFPDFRTESGLPHNKELERLVAAGLAERGLPKTAEVEERISHELSIIERKGYTPYFLVVADLLRYAKRNGIFTTTRGSAGGSLVSYLVGITTVNPIEYKLPFERFLNPERPSPPDIDMDIADDRRDKLIDYVREKYGDDKVAQIGTFGTMMARGSVRDVARALGYDYATGDRIAKLIPFGSQGFPMSINRALEIVPELAELYRKDADGKAIIDMAKKIEGCARHISVHAAGVVISPTPLTDYVPLQYDPKGEGKIITQYDMYAVEEAGLLKFDFLGIKNLSILASAVSLAEKLEGKKIEIEKIPLDDKGTYEILARGETGGLFQLSGSGITRYLKDLKPTSIHDINAMVALYRPGPMESIPQFIERKHNPNLVNYLDKRLKEILDQSYGVITYQDDVLQIAVKLAGYSWMEADKLRKAMGKKIPAEMESQKEKFIAGGIRNGLSPEKAKKLWSLIEPFAAYGFNKAHAASYGKVAYQTAFMKAHFPAIYMSAVLTADSGDVERIGEIIGECKRMGIPVLPPSVNESFAGFTVVKGSPNQPDKIRFGLTTIKNFGEGVAESIIKERRKGGPFTSIENLLERVQDKNLNKKSLESLIKAGALDEFGERGTLLHNLEKLLLYHKEQACSPDNQYSLFGEESRAGRLRLDEATPASAAEKLAWEKELLGLYISGHPLDKHRLALEKREPNIKKAREEYQEGMNVVLAGIIDDVRKVITKNNDVMVFIKLSDFSGTIEAVLFPRVLAEHKDLIAPERCIALKGRISHRNGEVSIVAEKIKELKE